MKAPVAFPGSAGKISHCIGRMPLLSCIKNVKEFLRAGEPSVALSL